MNGYWFQWVIRCATQIILRTIIREALFRMTEQAKTMRHKRRVRREMRFQRGPYPSPRRGRRYVMRGYD